jgi:hypothetical protein
MGFERVFVDLSSPKVESVSSGTLWSLLAHVVDQCHETCTLGSDSGSIGLDGSVGDNAGGALAAILVRSVSLKVY